MDDTSLNNKGPGIPHVNDPSSEGCWQGNQASPSVPKELHRETGDSGSTEKNASLQQPILSDGPHGCRSRNSGREKEVQAVRGPVLEVDQSHLRLCCVMTAFPPLACYIINGHSRRDSHGSKSVTKLIISRSKDSYSLTPRVTRAGVHLLGKTPTDNNSVV